MQVLWNKRVGEELAFAGHNVTIFMIRMYDDATQQPIAIDPRVRGEFAVPFILSLKDCAHWIFPVPRVTIDSRTVQLNSSTHRSA